MFIQRFLLLILRPWANSEDMRNHWERLRLKCGALQARYEIKHTPRTDPTRRWYQHKHLGAEQTRQPPQKKTIILVHFFRCTAIAKAVYSRGFKNKQHCNNYSRNIEDTILPSMRRIWNVLNSERNFYWQNHVISIGIHTSKNSVWGWRFPHRFRIGFS